MVTPVWQAIILGVLQGLTEFLPISSSAHLILLPWLMGWPAMGVIFDVVIHGGTLGAVLLYFWKDWRDLTFDFLRRIRGIEPTRNPAILDAIGIGTVPAVIIALLFRDSIETYARQPIVTVLTLSVFGAALLWSDRHGRRLRGLSDLTRRDGLLIGLVQATALIPGVSRSGVTITMALWLGYSRPEAARFSFLLAAPVIALGALKGILELNGGLAEGALDSTNLIAGVFVSFMVGFFCIKYFLRFLETKTYLPFVIYRWALAAVILAVVLLRG